MNTIQSCGKHAWRILKRFFSFISEWDVQSYFWIFIYLFMHFKNDDHCMSVLSNREFYYMIFYCCILYLLLLFYWQSVSYTVKFDNKQSFGNKTKFSATLYFCSTLNSLFYWATLFGNKNLPLKIQTKSIILSDYTRRLLLTWLLNHILCPLFLQRTLYNCFLKSQFVYPVKYVGKNLWAPGSQFVLFL